MLAKVFKNWNAYHLYAFLIIAFATIFRIVLSVLQWPATESDEATYNLMALHIWKNGAHPIFMYGGNYLGALEAYIGSVLFRVFGPSVLVMRIEIAGMFALFLLGLYLLTYRVYTPRFALITIAFLAPGTELMLHRQLAATGGNAEINVFGVFVLLISFILALGKVGKGWQRAILYLLWGILSGLALWSHLLIAPYLLISGLLLLIFCWKEILKWGIWLQLVGFVIGGFPLIYYNLTAPADAKSWVVYSQVSSMGTTANDSLRVHIIRTLLVSMPVMTGNRLANYVMTWPSSLPHALRYAVVQSGWSSGLCLLLLISIALAIVALMKSRRQGQPEPVNRDEQVQQVTRLLLGCAAVLTIILYIKGSATIVDAYNSARYFTILCLSIPAFLWPLWLGLRYIRALPLWLNACKLSFFAVIWVAIAGILLLSTFYTVQQVQPAQGRAQQTNQLVATLEQLHITRFYTEYWTCNEVIFASQEQLICGDTWTINGTLSHGFDRYLPYQEMLKATTNPAFVYPETDSSHLQVLEKLIAQQHIAYQRIDTDGYAIFLLSQPLQHTNL